MVAWCRCVPLRPCQTRGTLRSTGTSSTSRSFLMSLRSPNPYAISAAAAPSRVQKHNGTAAVHGLLKRAEHGCRDGLARKDFLGITWETLLRQKGATVHCGLLVVGHGRCIDQAAPRSTEVDPFSRIPYRYGKMCPNCPRQSRRTRRNFVSKSSSGETGPSGMSDDAPLGVLKPEAIRPQVSSHSAHLEELNSCRNQKIFPLYAEGCGR